MGGVVEDDEIGGSICRSGSRIRMPPSSMSYQARSRIPLLVTSDFENGGPGMRINHSYALPSLLPQGGGTSFPPTMAFGAMEMNASLGSTAELRHWRRRR